MCVCLLVFPPVYMSISHFLVQNISSSLMLAHVGGSKMSTQVLCTCQCRFRARLRLCVQYTHQCAFGRGDASPLHRPYFSEAHKSLWLPRFISCSSSSSLHASLLHDVAFRMLMPLPRSSSCSVEHQRVDIRRVRNHLVCSNQRQQVHRSTCAKNGYLQCSCVRLQEISAWPKMHPNNQHKQTTL